METKKCSKCNNFLPIASFHKSSIHKSGYTNSCKTCESERSKTKYLANRKKYLEDHRIWKQKNVERVKLIGKKYYEKRKAYFQNKHNEWYRNNKDKKKIQQRHWRSAHPESEKKTYLTFCKNHPLKHKAHMAINKALRNGILKKIFCCEKCGSKKKTQAHHEDYSKPLDVMWLCVQCHTEVHGRLVK